MIQVNGSALPGSALPGDGIEGNEELSGDGDEGKLGWLPIRVDLSRDQYLSFMTAGRSCWDLARASGVPEQRVQLLRSERDDLYQEHIRISPIAIEGVVKTLAELAPRYRMAIVTSARRRDLNLIHAARDLLRYFEFVLTIEDYERPKPHPDSYLAGLARFGARPHEALVLEGSARGLSSARAAGIRCLVVRSPFTASQDFSKAWRVVDSIRQVPETLAAQQGGEPDVE